jgi:hypothetical protein
VCALDVLSSKNIAVAGQTKLGTFGGDKLRIRTGMGHVTRCASANLERRMHLGALELAQHITVAVETELGLGLDEILVVIACVRAVATRAGALGDGAMHIDFVELFFFVRVARVTERLDWNVEQRRLFRSMRIMARRT